jgi:hypothetical protein
VIFGAMACVLDDEFDLRAISSPRDREPIAARSSSRSRRDPRGFVDERNASLTKRVNNNRREKIDVILSASPFATADAQALPPRARVLPLPKDQKKIPVAAVGLWSCGSCARKAWSKTRR